MWTQKEISSIELKWTKQKNRLYAVWFLSFTLSVILGGAEDKLLMKCLVTENMGIEKCITLIVESISKNKTHILKKRYTLSSKWSENISDLIFCI